MTENKAINEFLQRYHLETPERTARQIILRCTDDDFKNLDYWFNEFDKSIFKHCADDMSLSQFKEAIQKVKSLLPPKK
jgi:hypothetical protein